MHSSPSSPQEEPHPPDPALLPRPCLPRRWATTAGGVTLLSAGLDEAPMAYKDIHQVMAAQSDLVEILGRFDPKLVKMAPSGSGRRIEGGR